MENNFFKKISKIQGELKAPKNQRNNFGGYNYRSCEDILEAVKPLLVANDLFITIQDDIVLVGDRYYVKATATITDGEHSVSNTALAREELSKKGMDASQITGATSSYARKYALNGLLAIDDTKDADATNKHDKVDDALIKKFNTVKDYLQKNPLTKEVEARALAVATELNVAGLTKEHDELLKLIGADDIQF